MQRVVSRSPRAYGFPSRPLGRLLFGPLPAPPCRPQLPQSRSLLTNVFRSAHIARESLFNCTEIHVMKWVTRGACCHLFINRESIGHTHLGVTSYCRVAWRAKKPVYRLHYWDLVPSPKLGHPPTIFLWPARYRDFNRVNLGSVKPISYLYHLNLFGKFEI
jgi:hypothetical protein